MKNNKRKITQSSLPTVILLAFCGFMISGCGHSSSGSAAATTNTVAPGVSSVTTNTTNAYSYSGGGTATFVPVSTAVMSTYVAIHPLNAPTNYEINVNLSNTGNGYGGAIQIGYTDNGQTYNSNLNSGSGNIYNSDGYNNQAVTQFNQWFTYNGSSVFHGFFQDQYGAVILVIDTLQSNGDGSTASTVSGSVWFKNFGPQNCDDPPPGADSCGQSQSQCQYIEIGPYDCQAFMNSSGRITTTSNEQTLTPGNGYTKLGTFSGLNFSSAFGN